MSSLNLSINLNEKEDQLRHLLLDVAKYAEEVGEHNAPELRFAGGWVRDKLLGFTSGDIDIAINNMTGIHFGRLMKAYLEQRSALKRHTGTRMGVLAEIEANPEKSKHLETVTTKIFGLEIDLVNLRKETYTDSSRTPSMDFGSPEEDALRRDATINALFFNITTKKVEDFSGRGIRDLELGIIKTPLDPLQTFLDDPLRILRAIRFASRFNFAIDENDMSAMRDAKVKGMLQKKISRERIGTELTKMLKGPHPHKSLALLDDLGLYGTVFTNDQSVEHSGPGVRSWNIAYDTLEEMLGSKDSSCTSSKTADLKTLQQLLIRNPDERFLAWMLACFTPWARLHGRESSLPEKKTPSLGSSAAKEGLKADNKICKIIDDAIKSLGEVILHKDRAGEIGQTNDSATPQALLSKNRELYGTAIRSWGINWRCNVLFAVLTEAAEARSETMMHAVFRQYASWLREIEALALLDADKLKPLVNGKQLLNALNVKVTGPWVKNALDVTMVWQLRHPDATDASDALSEVVARRVELGIPG